MRLCILIAALLILLMLPRKFSDASPPQPADSAYPGFDLNVYPGDPALPTLRKDFSFVGYWLSPPPEAKENTWAGKREIIKSRGLGFALLYTGPQSKELKSEADARQKATNTARKAAANAKQEQFAAGAIIFLDVEEGGRLPASYHAYLQAWADELTRAGYRPGVYCSGIPVSEGRGVTIITADDIRNHIGARELTYWIFNDACPPSPGCTLPRLTPAPSRGGVRHAAIWQFTRSPRVKELTARCKSTYSPDGNCYAPSDSAHAWFLDMDTATSADPSGGRNELARITKFSRDAPPACVKSDPSRHRR
jgi:Domain of unknown function (DUF1906)